MSITSTKMKNEFRRLHRLRWITLGSIVFLVFSFSAKAMEAATPPAPQTSQPKQVYVVPFSHLDLWYLGTPPDAYARFERILSGALDLADQDPGFRFTIENGHFLQQYLRLRPEAQPRIARAMARGQLDLSAQWSDLLECPATAEDVVRNVLLPVQMSERMFHYRPRGVVVGDVPGFNPQLPQVWRRSGIEGAMLSRGGPLKNPIFNWEAPDGSAVRIGYTVGGYATGWMAGLPFSLASAEAKSPITVYQSVRHKEVTFNTGLAKLVDQGFPGPGPAIMGAGPDLSFPSSRLTKVVAEWNREHGQEMRVHVVTIPEFVKATEKDKLPTLSGDWQSVWQPASYSVDRHATLARTSHALQVAEKIATVASLLTPVPYPGKELKRAWEWQLTALDHEGAALPNLPDRIEEVAQEIQEQSAQVIASRIPTKNKEDMVVAVFNPLAWKRRVAIRVPLFLHGDIPSDGARWDQIIVRDENGKILPAHLRVTPPHAVSKTGELFAVLDLPPLGYRSIILEPADKNPVAAAEAAPWDTLEWTNHDASSETSISQGDWKAQYQLSSHAVALIHGDQTVAHVEIDDLAGAPDVKTLESMRPVGENAVTWNAVRQQDSWNDSILDLEGRNGMTRIRLRVELTPATAPVVSSEVLWIGALQHYFVQRITPTAWSLPAVRYGVPFGEMKFNQTLPGAGPTNPGDEVPPALWGKMKTLDGWLSWQNGDGVMTAATEARGAIFSDNGFSFILAPSKGVFPKPLQQVSLRMSFQYSDAGAQAAPEKTMWELLEPPVTAVAEDRYGSMNLPPQFSLLHWNQPGLIVTGLYRDEAGSVVVRTYNHGETPVQAELTTGLPTTGLEAVSPVESPIRKVSTNLRFTPWEIETLRFTAKTEQTPTAPPEKAATGK